MTSDRDVPYGSMILVPGIITLGVTLLRLTGERLGWSKTFFNPAPGGGGALVGIAWLVPVFGILFAVKLARMGHGPESWGKALGLAFAAIGVSLVAIIAVNVLKTGFYVGLPLIAIASVVSIGIAWKGWPALAKALLLYGLAARIPVVVVALLAMLGDWRTHYDLPPPEFPQMGVFAKFLLIGLMPQLTLWLVYTVAIGMICGAIAYAAVGRKEPALA